MKRWPLRWKLACYAAALAVLATLAGAFTTWSVMRFSEIAALDRKVAADAQQFFRSAKESTNDRAVIQEKLAALMTSDRFVELRDLHGALLFQSTNLRGALLDDGVEKSHNREIEGSALRVAEFRDGGLKLRIGADLGAIHQIGWDIVLGMFAAIPTVLIVITIGGRWVARRALAPVEAIRQAASRITVHNLDQRLPVPPADDEIAGL
ncbi:MAG: two-component system, OmpR family, sensor kinase, partial [Verrucomicrobiota bacterium]